MELIYKNKYGSSFSMDNVPNAKCRMQLVIGSTGIFMSEYELINLLEIVKNSHEPCTCEICDGDRCNKIWTTNSLIDICIKVDDVILELLEDLILGTLFILNMKTTLEENKIMDSK